MSDYYWIDDEPTELHLDYICQLQYMIHPVDDLIFEVRSINRHDRTDSHRTFLPMHYHAMLAKVLWRIALLIEFHENFKTNPAITHAYTSFHPRLLRLLVHLDNVIESLIRPAVGMGINEISRYHSRNFEEFIVTEIVLHGRHDPPALRAFRETYGINIERLKESDLSTFS